MIDIHDEKLTNKTKMSLELIKVFNLPVGRLNSKSYHFNAAHANFLCYFSSLEGNIGECKK